MTKLYPPPSLFIAGAGMGTGYAILAFSQGPACRPSGRVQRQMKLDPTSFGSLPLWVSISSNVKWKSHNPCSFLGPDKD